VKMKPSDDANKSSGSGMEDTGGTRRIRDGSMRCEGSDRRWRGSGAEELRLSLGAGGCGCWLISLYYYVSQLLL